MTVCLGVPTGQCVRSACDEAVCWKSAHGLMYSTGKVLDWLVCGNAWLVSVWEKYLWGSVLASAYGSVGWKVPTGNAWEVPVGHCVGRVLVGRCIGRVLVGLCVR